MSIFVETLREQEEDCFEEFIASQPTGMFFSTLKYRTLLKNLLGAEDLYLIAKDGAGSIVGVLPAFLHECPATKPVMNSLPFYGSHGGGITGDVEVKKTLLSRLHTIARERNCISTTVITSPFEQDLAVYEVDSGVQLRDERIGQVTALTEPGEDADAAVMGMVPSKTRNMIRKASKSGVYVSTDKFPGIFDFLHATHEANMNEIGGMPKPRRFFDLVDEVYEYGRDYEIYTGWIDGVPVAAMLLFYFTSFVEYFTPAIVKDYRAYQPLSLLIYRGMVDAVQHGRKHWNWGGTWKEQDGVYRFKKSWGAKDYPYHYFTNVYDLKSLKGTREDMLLKYPYFYVLPFSALKA